MQPKPLLSGLTEDDVQCLGNIDAALAQLDRAFAYLSDPAFEQLPKEYRQLAGAVLRVYAERSRFVA